MVRIPKISLGSSNAGLSGFATGLSLTTPSTPKSTDAFRIAITDLIRQRQMEKMFEHQINLLETRLQDMWRRSQTGTYLSLQNNPLISKVANILDRKEGRPETKLAFLTAFVSIPNFKIAEEDKKDSGLTDDEIETLKNFPPEYIPPLATYYQARAESNKQPFDFDVKKYSKNYNDLLQSVGAGDSTNLISIFGGLIRKAIKEGSQALSKL